MALCTCPLFPPQITLLPALSWSELMLSPMATKPFIGAREQRCRMAQGSRESQMPRCSTGRMELPLLQSFARRHLTARQLIWTERAFTASTPFQHSLEYFLLK